jgi:hypothetical protein
MIRNTAVVLFLKVLSDCSLEKKLLVISKLCKAVRVLQILNDFAAKQTDP